MLKHLSITNYAIIEKLELKINNGFTVITGETGAGKSILLGALSLILGQRVDTSVLNDKEKKCIIEGEFEIEKNQFIDLFERNELDFEEPNILRREINAKGKSRAFINDTPVSLSVLKELTGQLIDIHSQHQTLKIQDSKFQISVVDAFASLDIDLSSYKKKFVQFIIDKKELKELEDRAIKAKSETDYISFQVNEIEDLQLKPNEKEEIESELELINNAEEIKSVLSNSGDSLTNSDRSILSELKSITNSYSNIVSCSPKYNSIYNRLNSLVLELEDISVEIDNCNTDLQFNPESLSYLNDRLGKIFSIEQKHNISSTKEILYLLDELVSKLLVNNSYDEKLQKLTKKVNKQEKDLFTIAGKLSKQRVDSFKALNKEIENNLAHLGMRDASFSVDHEILNSLTESGIDSIKFMFSANKGFASVELKKAASGGELSRLMLTIKSILAKNNKLSSIIFDEIDTGVSGDIADKMAGIMKQMSANMQVLSITHLPQVAAKGKHHLRIFKKNIKGKTVTSLVVLEKKDRVEELAKMLSGKEMSSAAIDNAQSLLNS